MEMMTVLIGQLLGRSLACIAMMQDHTVKIRLHLKCKIGGLLSRTGTWSFLTVDVRQRDTHRPRGTNSYGHLEANHSEKAIRGQIPVESATHPEKV